MLALRDFAMLCNNAEYKKMGQKLSMGQLYDLHNENKDLYKALVGPTHLLRQGKLNLSGTYATQLRG
jgi:hypothetical protein